MFSQYAFRPFWHPNSLPGFLYPDVQRLTQELDKTRQRLTRCENKILTLNAELEAYRRIVRCIYAEKVPPSVAEGPNLIPGRFDHFSVSPTSRDLRPDATTAPSAATSVNTIPSNNPQANRFDWSVVYNPEVKKSIEVTVVDIFKYSPNSVRCLKFSPDGRYLAIGLQCNGKTHIYDINTGEEKCVLKDLSTKDELSIWAVHFSPDSKRVATGGSDGQICIWEIEQRKMRAMLKGHTGDVFSLAFSPDGRYLVSGSYDDSVRIWRLRDGSSWELFDNALGYFAVCFSPDGEYIAAANSDKTLRLWRTRTGKLADRWLAHTESASTVAFTLDGKGLVSGSNDLSIKYWDVSSIGLTPTPSSESSPRLKAGIFRLEGHTAPVRSVAFLPNRRLLLSGSNDQTVRIWDSDSAAWQCALEGHKHRVVSVDASQAGDYLASGSLHGEVILWKYV